MVAESMSGESLNGERRESLVDGVDETDCAEGATCDWGLLLVCTIGNHWRQLAVVCLDAFITAFKICLQRRARRLENKDTLSESCKSCSFVATDTKREGDVKIVLKRCIVAAAQGECEDVLQRLVELEEVVEGEDAYNAYSCRCSLVLELLRVAEEEGAAGVAGPDTLGAAGQTAHSFWGGGVAGKGVMMLSQVNADTLLQTEVRTIPARAKRGLIASKCLRLVL